jgi:hypothetical protein
MSPTSYQTAPPREIIFKLSPDNSFVNWKLAWLDCSSVVLLTKTMPYATSNDEKVFQPNCVTSQKARGYPPIQHPFVFPNSLRSYLIAVKKQ